MSRSSFRHKRVPSLELSTPLVDSYFVAHRAFHQFLAEQAKSSYAPSPPSASTDAAIAEVELAMEQYRMAVTNLGASQTHIDESRANLERVLERAIGSDRLALVIREMNTAIGIPDGGESSSVATPLALAESRERNSSSSSYLEKSCYVQTRMQRVVTGVFIGSYHPAANKALLEAHGITHVCCCIDVRPRFPDQFKYVTLPADDSPTYNIAQHFDKTFRFIDEAVTRGGGVLIHCGAGISRAPTILAAYLIRKLHISAVSAVQMIRAVRSCASPNLGFMTQLQQFQTAVHGKHDLAAYVGAEPDQPPVLLLEYK